MGKFEQKTIIRSARDAANKRPIDTDQKRLERYRADAKRIGWLRQQEQEMEERLRQRRERINQRIQAASERAMKERDAYATQHFSNEILQDARHSATVGMKAAANAARINLWQQMSKDVTTIQEHRNGTTTLNPKQLVSIFRRIENTAKALYEGTSIPPQILQRLDNEFARVRKQYENDTQYAIENMGKNIFTGKE